MKLIIDKILSGVKCFIALFTFVFLGVLQVSCNSVAYAGGVEGTVYNRLWSATPADPPYKQTPIASQFVIELLDDHSKRYIVQSDTIGHYRIALPPGRYRAIAKQQDVRLKAVIFDVQENSFIKQDIFYEYFEP